MNFILFHLRRFLIFLTDLAIFPFRKFRELWSDSSRGRALVFGLPALLIAAAAVISVIVGMSSQERFASNYDISKRRAENEGEYADAIVYAQKLVQFQPDDKDLKWELSRILFADTRDETRDASFRTGRSIRRSLAPDNAPGYPKAHVWVAREILKLKIPGRSKAEQRSSFIKILSKAESHLEFALATEPDNPDARTLMANKIMIPQGKYDEALEIYEELFEDYVGFFTSIVELHLRKGTPDDAIPVVDEAIRRYEILLESDPDKVDYLRRLSSAHAMKRDYVTSEKILTEAIERQDDPKKQLILEEALARMVLSQAVNFKGFSSADAESRKKYLGLLKRAFEVNPTSVQAAVLVTRFGFANFPESNEALEIFDAREQRDQASSEALQIAGTAEVLRGDKLLGIRLLELAIQKNARNHEALNNLAFVISESDPQRALELATIAIGIQPRNAGYFDTRGNIYMQLGEWVKATADLEFASKDARLKLKPAVFESLVECYKQQNMIGTAAKIQKQADELKRKQGGADLSPSQ